MRARVPVGAWLIAATIVLVCGVALVLSGRSLSRVALIHIIEQAGVPVRSLRVRSLSYREAEFGRIALGTPDGPEANSARAVFTVPRLFRGRIDRLILRQPKLSISLADGSLNVAGMPGFAADRELGVSPLRRIDMIDTALTAATPIGVVVVYGDASLVADTGGGMRLERALVRRAALSVARGTISVSDAEYREGQPVETVIEIDAIDLAGVLELLDVEGLSGTGELDGRLPIKIDAAGVHVAGGQVGANGPGTIRYVGDALPDVGSDDGNKDVSERIGLVRAALADFRYTSLVLTLDRTASGETTLVAKLDGANPAVLDGHPFAINLRLDANFDKLASVLIEGYAAAARMLGAP
jgi:hypothetical protein